MKVNDILISNVSITEDGGPYRAIFTASAGAVSMVLDLTELDSQLAGVRSSFGLTETDADIARVFTDKVMALSADSSHITEGEDYQDDDSAIEGAIGSLDRA